ncbi:hypothetical protein [Pyrobaculum ferrireducens]|uniref:Uncharacterized protein n=1 Tax=Pyrobaculum ferrireducens TaxID=1104324 RepID=G7VIE2_9CREN|nr:hypothetical protein [Pyrobaculum ferrireducens]AET33422.1 hypothetical protein P186_2025 [Pyrobaculum ferrireducens]
MSLGWRRLSASLGCLVAAVAGMGCRRAAVAWSWLWPLAGVGVGLLESDGGWTPAVPGRIPL